MSIGIYVATNRLVRLPLPEGYHVLALGRQQPPLKGQIHIGKADVLFETEGENIVEKNPFFCELTGFYWLLKNRWKELEDYVGVCQYRRYFSFHPDKAAAKGTVAGAAFASLIDAQGLEAQLRQADFHVLEAERFAPQTVGRMYALYHRAEDLSMLRKVIEEQSPDYLFAFDEVMQRQEMHGRNMFVTSRRHFLCYSEWLLGLLLRLEKRVEIPYEDKYQRRLFGFLAERMLDVYLTRHHLTCRELPMVQLNLDKAVPRDYDRKPQAAAEDMADRALAFWQFLRDRRFTAAAREEELPTLARLLRPREGDRLISLYQEGKIPVPALLKDMEQQIGQGRGRAPHAYLFFTPHYRSLRPYLVRAGYQEGRDFIDATWLLRDRSGADKG